MANPISVTIDFTKKLLLIFVGAVGVSAINAPALGLHDRLRCLRGNPLGRDAT